MAGNTVTDFLFQPVGNTLSTWQNQWVGLVHNVLGTAYKSTAPTSSTGQFTVQNIPSGLYTMYTSATGTGLPPGGAWSVTLDTAYRVGDAGDTFNVVDFGPVGTSDDTATFQAAITAAGTKGRVVVPGPGPYIVNQLSITNPITFGGDSRGSSVLQAKSGATGPLLNVQLSGQGAVVLRDFEVDMTNATGIDVIALNNGLHAQLSNIKVFNGGAKGLNLTSTNQSSFDHLVFWDQTTAGVVINGDACGELSFYDIDISRRTAGTLTSGFEIDRANSADVGAFYLTNVRVTRAGGSITNGFNFNETGGSVASTPIFMVSCVSDNVDISASVLFTKWSGLKAVNSWFTNASGAAQPSVRISGGQDFLFSNCTFIPDATGVSIDFVSAPTIIEISGNRFANAAALNMPASSPPTAITLGPNQLVGGATLTNDFTKLVAAISSQTSIGAPQILVSSGGGTANWLNLFNAVDTKHKYFRVNSAGGLEILNDAGSTIVATIDDTGRFTSYRSASVAGNGVVGIPQAPGYLTGQTAAVASVATLTSANDGIKHAYRVSASVLITTLGSGNIQAQVAYTDGSGAARTCNIPLMPENGAFATSATTADDWKGETVIIVNPNTSVTLATAGTFTSCTYNVGGHIEQLR